MKNFVWYLTGERITIRATSLESAIEGANGDALRVIHQFKPPLQYISVDAFSLEVPPNVNPRSASQGRLIAIARAQHARRAVEGVTKSGPGGLGHVDQLIVIDVLDDHVRVVSEGLPIPNLTDEERVELHRQFFDVGGPAEKLAVETVADCARATNRLLGGGARLTGQGLIDARMPPQRFEPKAIDGVCETDWVRSSSTASKVGVAHWRPGNARITDKETGWYGIERRADGKLWANVCPGYWAEITDQEKYEAKLFGS